MPRRLTQLQIQILELLYHQSSSNKRTRHYLSKIAHEIERAVPSVRTSLADLEERKIVQSNTTGKMRFFSLTEKGEALAWALLESEQLVEIYKSRRIKPDKIFTPFIEDINITLVESNVKSFLPVVNLLFRDSLREKHGTRLAFLMDFSEIYPLIVETSHFDETLSYILEEDVKLPYILPPPSAWETLSSFVKLCRYGDAYSELDSFLKNPYARGFYDIIRDRPTDPSVLYRRMNHFYRRMGGLRNVLTLLNHEKIIDQLQRLENLLDKRLSTLESVLPDTACDIDSKTYVYAHSGLSQLRPTEEDSNVIDSLNIALTYWLNDKLYRSIRQYYLHVTHSPSPLRVFQRIRWFDDPFGKHVLVRNPRYMIIFKMLKAKYIAVEKRLDFLSQNRNLMNELQKMASSLEFPRDAEELSSYQKACDLYLKYYKTCYKDFILEVLSKEASERRKSELNLLDQCFPVRRDEYADRIRRAHYLIMKKIRKTYELMKKREFIGVYDHIEPKIPFSIEELDE